MSQATALKINHAIDSLWSPSVDSQHHPAIYWAK